MYKKQRNKHINIFIHISRQPVLRAVDKGEADCEKRSPAPGCQWRWWLASPSPTWNDVVAADTP